MRDRDRIAEIAADYGEDLGRDPKGEPGLPSKLRERGSELMGRRSGVALAMLADLREVYTMAAGVSVDWEMLAQAAQGIKHQDLLAVCQRCHPETLRQMRWANGKLKEASTQILVS